MSDTTREKSEAYTAREDAASFASGKAPYGVYCPICGAPTINRSPSMQDTCGGTPSHTYQARQARVGPAVQAPYGYCPVPKCGAPGVERERRPNGNDKCANGHEYPSADALAERPPVPSILPRPDSPWIPKTSVYYKLEGYLGWSSRDLDAARREARRFDSERPRILKITETEEVVT